MSVVYELNLENRTAGHDKVYVIHVLEDAGSFEVVAYYGKRGARLREERKGRHSSKFAAVSAADSLADSKVRSRGYSHASHVPGTIPTAPSGASATSSTGSSSSSSLSGLAPEVALFEAEDIGTFFTSNRDAYAFQRKYDGERRFAVLTTGNAFGFNRERVQVTLSASIIAQLRAIVPASAPADARGVQAIFDGELLQNDKYVVFDLLHLGLHSLTHRSFEERYAVLEDVMQASDMLAPVAWGDGAGQAMVEEARKHGWEGLVAKLCGSPYFPGRTTAGVKLKLWESATCQVLIHNASRSVAIGLVKDGEIVPKGNVTIGGTIPLPPIGALIEVKYLYCHSGGSLYQPSYLGLRSDKTEADDVSTLKAPPPEKRD